MSRSSALVDVSPVVTPLATTDSTDVDTVLLVSTSVRVSVPVVDRGVSVSRIPAVSLSPLPTVMSGASFVPIIVIVTVSVSVPPLPSDTVTSYF